MIVAVDEVPGSFLGEPQPVEVFHSGLWHPGVLLGWRHDAEGRCWLRIRCVVGGLRHTAWIDLASLRLPESVPGDDVPSAVPAPRPHAGTWTPTASRRPTEPDGEGVPSPRRIGLAGALGA